MQPLVDFYITCIGKPHDDPSVWDAYLQVRSAVTRKSEAYAASLGASGEAVQIKFHLLLLDIVFGRTEANERVMNFLEAPNDWIPAMLPS